MPLHMGSPALKNPTFCGFSPLLPLSFVLTILWIYRGCSHPPLHARQKVSLGRVERAVHGNAFATSAGELCCCVSIGYITGLR